MYEGEVFTYRSDRAPRPVARPVRPMPAPAPSDFSRSDGPVPAERTARLEAGLLRLEDTIGQLAARVELLTGRLEELQAARVKAMAAPSEAPADPAAIKTTVTMLAPEPPPPEPAPKPAVKVSMYAGGATEAILGQVRVVSRD